VKPHVVVVSHACVLDANRSPYRTLATAAAVTIVTPAAWAHAFSPEPFQSSDAPFPGRVLTFPARQVGRPQRYTLRCWPGRVLRQTQASFVIIEEEAFSLSGLWWSWAARRHALPYAIQAAENLDRRFPAPVRRWRDSVLAHASLVMARSPMAGERAKEAGARGSVQVIAHGVDEVASTNAPATNTLVGFVGRLVPEKGVADLLTLARERPDWSFAVVGDGPLRSDVEAAGDNVRWLGSLANGDMPAFYATLAALVVPSRTTPTWTEQFGRIIIEALAQGVPVVAYDSGEIPWVASVTGAVLVAEGDVEALGEAVAVVLADQEQREVLATRGREAVRSHFTNEAAGRALVAWLDSFVS